MGRENAFYLCVADAASLERSDRQHAAFIASKSKSLSSFHEIQAGSSYSTQKSLNLLRNVVYSAITLRFMSECILNGDFKIFDQSLIHSVLLKRDMFLQPFLSLLFKIPS